MTTPMSAMGPTRASGHIVASLKLVVKVVEIRIPTAVLPMMIKR